jgi:hypothetical protein
MNMRYQHTQRGTWMMAGLLAAALLDAVVPWTSGLVAFIALIAAAVVFSSLTVEVSAKELKWYFGPGFWSYRLPLDDIQNVAVVRNHWWNGFGIRMRSGFRLYNVSGLDAVELQLKSGEIRRIGTDDPQALAEALKATGLRG